MLVSILLNLHLKCMYVEGIKFDYFAYWQTIMEQIRRYGNIGTI